MQYVFLLFIFVESRLNVNKIWMCLVLLCGMRTKDSRTALSLNEGYEGGTNDMEAAIGRLFYLSPSARCGPGLSIAINGYIMLSHSVKEKKNQGV